MGRSGAATFVGQHEIGRVTTSMRQFAADCENVSSFLELAEAAGVHHVTGGPPSSFADFGRRIVQAGG